MECKGLHVEYAPKSSVASKYRIAIVGTGRIVQDSHLPAYKKAGYQVVGLFGRTLEKAEKLAREYGIPKLYRAFQEVLDDPDLDIVDIALPPHLNLEYGSALIERGRHLLVQKPLSTRFADAKELVSMAEQRGVKLAVNQNGRWDPAIRAAKYLMDQGLLGKRITAFIELRTMQPWQEFWKDRRHYEHLMILGMSIHHLDQFRFLFGDPVRVNAVTNSYPGQPWAGDSIAHYWLEYEDGFFASGFDDGFTWTRDYGVRFRFTGVEGVIKGSMGWPDADYSRLQLFSKKLGDCWYEPEFETKWFPDAFIGTMGDLIDAIEYDRDPTISGLDNLDTLRLVFAAYRSSEEKRAVDPREIE